jgi:predicted nucleotidyltransferase
MKSKQPFSTAKLDQILSDRQVKIEQERLLLLSKILQWLEEFNTCYGIEQAYIFGSILRPGKFHQDSDIDLAVSQINPDDYCTVISLLHQYLGREVDLIILDTCHFSNRIRDTGLLWTKTP